MTKLYLALLTFFLWASGADAHEQVCANFNEPIFTVQTQQVDNRLVRLPKDAPNPAMITRMFAWLQLDASTTGAAPLTMNGDVSWAIDPSLQYSKSAGFPQVQVAVPMSLNTLGALELRNDRRQFMTFNYPVPFGFRHGDAIVVAPEVADSADPPTHINIIWTVCWQAMGARVNACGVSTRTMINPESDDGLNPTADTNGVLSYVTDASFSNHQVVTHNIVISTSLGAPSMLFDGLDSSAIIIDGAGDIGTPIFDYDWANDFTIETEINTTDVSQDTQYREILTGVSPSNVGAATAPLLVVSPSGHVMWGNAAALTLNGTSNVADGVTHNIAISRTAGVTRLFVDGMLQASATDTLHYVSPQMSIGRYPVSGGGRWHGHIRHLRITSGSGLYQTNYTVPVWPAC